MATATKPASVLFGASINDAGFQAAIHAVRTLKRTQITLQIIQQEYKNSGAVCSEFRFALFKRTTTDTTCAGSLAYRSSFRLPSIQLRYKNGGECTSTSKNWSLCFVMNNDLSKSSQFVLSHTEHSKSIMDSSNYLPCHRSHTSSTRQKLHASRQGSWLRRRQI